MLTDQRSALPNIVLNHIFLLSNYFEDIEKKKKIIIGYDKRCFRNLCIIGKLCFFSKNNLSICEIERLLDHKFRLKSFRISKTNINSF